MTFTEAAVEVLKREGKPLHFRKIAEIAIHENLLDHVGKVPEDTMADQLVAHCKLPRPDRAIVVIQHGTFALEEWGLPEDVTGLDNLVELPPADEPPYRPKERHPIPARELSRGAGRDGGRGRRREEGDEKKRRYPPPAEVAYEILSGADRALTLRELAALGAERLLMPDAFVRDVGSLAAALREDNRRREQAGRKALFGIEGDLVSLGAVPEPGERPAAVAVARAPASPAEMRRSALAALRRRLRECDGPTIEHLVGRLLEKSGMREVKVAKRGRDSVVFTARLRMGLIEVRHAIRVLRNGADVGRRDVTDVRRDLGHYGAQIGMLVTSGEAQREARGEAAAAGQLPILLVAGEAFAEAFADAGVACRIVSIPEADEEFLAAATEAAQREEEARRARREERDRREEREDRGRDDRGRDRDRDRREERRSRPPTEGAATVAIDTATAGAPAEGTSSAATVAATAPAEGSASDAPPVEGAVVAAAAAREDASPAPSQALPAAPEGSAEGDADDGEGDDEEGGDEGPEAPASGASPGEAQREGAPGDGRRRRRRRRRRGGRGRGERRPEGSGTGEGGEGGGGSPPPAPSGGDAPPSGGA